MRHDWGQDPSSLAFTDTAEGLHMRAVLPKSETDVANAVAKAKRGVLNGLSVGMIVRKDSWDADGTERVIHRASLAEVSLVHRPANEQARVTSARAKRGSLELRNVPLAYVDLRQDDDADTEGMIACVHCGGKGRLSSGVLCPVCAGLGLVEDDGEDDDGRAARAGYAAHELAILGGKGQAFKNPDGHWSFPTRTPTDLSNAIQAIGRTPAGLRNAIRRYIMARARKMGLSHLVPDSWAPDGSLRSRRSCVLAGGWNDPAEVRLRRDLLELGIVGRGLVRNDTEDLYAELDYLNAVAAYRARR